MLKYVPGQVVGVELVHTSIMDRAEELANTKIAQSQTLPAFVSGQIYRYDPVQSQSGGLTLSVEPMIDNTLTDEQRQQVWDIGADAIEQAVVEHGDLLVAGILQDAMEGTNYFDRFTG